LNINIIGLYDRVRVQTNELTSEKGIADWVGAVQGVITIPAADPATKDLAGLGDVVGELKEGFLYGVHFEQTSKLVWLASHLVEFEDHNPGYKCSMSGQPLIRLESGEWQKCAA
jgi:hypothetical protein